MGKYKEVGTWWLDIKLVEIDNRIFALNGWNSKQYVNCWEIAQNKIDTIDSGTFIITPIYEEDFKIIGYDVR